jgi:uncharacterized protein
MARESIGAVHLVLTSACNLRCGYCYQDRRSRREMDWSTLRRTLDWILSLEEARRRVVFSGGEPTLVLPLIRRAVLYVEERSTPQRSVQWSVQTNGTLLDEDALDFLAAHDIEVHLSFDGVPAAQDARSPGTFDHLDRVLDWFRERRHERSRDRLTVMMTVAPDTVSTMAASFAYFLRKGVANLSISPTYAVPERPPQTVLDELAAAFERIGESCISHFRACGEIPFLAMRGDRGPGPHPWRSRTMCGVMRGRSAAVDVDGSVYGCVMLVKGIAGRALPWLTEELARLRIGHVDDPSLQSAFEVFAERAQGSAILTGKERKRSGIAACSTCRAIGDCDLCPVSIGLSAGNFDPDRVPDFACAFNRAAFGMRERFHDAVAKADGIVRA